MTNLSRTLCQALALGLGERADFFDALFSKHTSYLRINHYPPCPNPVAADFPLHSPDPKTEGYLAINRHTDAGVLTVLRQSHTEPHSLQVFISDDADKDHESRKVCIYSYYCLTIPHTLRPESTASLATLTLSERAGTVGHCQPTRRSIYNQHRRHDAGVFQRPLRSATTPCACKPSKLSLFCSIFFQSALFNRLHATSDPRIACLQQSQLGRLSAEAFRRRLC